MCYNNFHIWLFVMGLVSVGPTLLGRPVLVSGQLIAYAMIDLQEGGDTESVVLVHGFYNDNVGLPVNGCRSGYVYSR
jgi:hypothetical protein